MGGHIRAIPGQRQHPAGAVADAAGDRALGQHQRQFELALILSIHAHGLAAELRAFDDDGVLACAEIGEAERLIRPNHLAGDRPSIVDQRCRAASTMMDDPVDDAVGIHHVRRPHLQEGHGEGMAEKRVSGAFVGVTGVHPGHAIRGQLRIRHAQGLHRAHLPLPHGEIGARLVRRLIHRHDLLSAVPRDPAARAEDPPAEGTGVGCRCRIKQIQEDVMVAAVFLRGQVVHAHRLPIPGARRHRGGSDDDAIRLGIVDRLSRRRRGRPAGCRSRWPFFLAGLAAKQSPYALKQAHRFEPPPPPLVPPRPATGA